VDLSFFFAKRGLVNRTFFFLGSLLLSACAFSGDLEKRGHIYFLDLI